MERQRWVSKREEREEAEWMGRIKKSCGRELGRRRGVVEGSWEEWRMLTTQNKEGKGNVEMNTEGK